MYLSIDTAGRVSLNEADDLTRLHLELDGVDRAEADGALRAAGLGGLGGDEHAQIDLAALRSLAAKAAGEPGWAAGWDAMIEYARGKQWVSEDGRTVRVHIER